MEKDEDEFEENYNPEEDSERDEGELEEMNKEKIENDYESEKKEDEIPGDIKERERKQNIQTKWAIFLMVAVLIIILAFPYINQNFLNRVWYGGLEFQKTKLGDLVFYTAKFPVISSTGQVIGEYGVNLRNDPRNLEYISVNITNDIVKFAIIEPTYISLNPFMEKCDSTIVAMSNLAGFLGDSGLKVKSAVTDKAYARDNNQTHRWCTTSGFDTVIVVTNGSSTEINEIGINCYELKFKDCEILQVAEKFELLILEQYANRINE